MTREDILSTYQPIREAVIHVLKASSESLSRADLQRAVRWLGGADGKLPVAEEEDVNFVIDLALFEPNQRARRAFDRFLAQAPDRLSPAEAAVAVQMGSARFSIFGVVERHPAAGLWLDDLLHPQRLWLVDLALERTAQIGMTVAMRLFEAGSFHVGFGLVVVPDDDEVAEAIAIQQASGQPCYREPLAARLYRLDIQQRAFGLIADPGDLSH